MAPPDLAQDQLVAERFVLRRYLRSGRLGELWLADDLQTHQTVAVRFLSPYLDQTPGFRAAFLAAANTLVDLDHPAVVRGIAVGLDEYDRPLLACSYVPGGSVADWVGERHTVRDAALVGEQLAQALDYLHRRGIVHGDLRPSAVALDADGRCVLLDPGMPAAETRDGHEITPRWATRAYASPDRTSSPSTDLYSVAAIVYALIVGGHPNAMGWDLADRVPTPLASVLARAVSIRSALRFQSAAEMAEALGALTSPIP